MTSVRRILAVICSGRCVATCVAALLAAGSAMASAPSGARGTEIPRTVVVGQPRGHAPRDRVDAHRTGRTMSPLPATTARWRWQRDFAAGLELPPVVDAEGGVISWLVTSEVVRVDRDGKVSWRRRTSCAPGAVAPALTSDGGVALICADGSLERIERDGTLQRPVALGGTALRTTAAPLPRDDGGLDVALDDELVRIDADGVVTARTGLGAAERAVGGLVGVGAQVIATGEYGTVWRWQPPNAAVQIGSFGGAVDGGAVYFGPRAFVAVVGKSRVVALDPVTQATRVLIEGQGARGFDGPVTSTFGRGLLVATQGGELVSLPESGDEAPRVPLNPQAIGAASGTPRATVLAGYDLGPAPAMLVDAEGTVAFLRPTGRLGLVSREGQVTVLEPSVCSQPLGLMPAGPGRIAVACRGGHIAVWGDK